ncbi:CHAP domain-containing protein, partial [Patescibacteria group bacterium]
KKGPKNPLYPGYYTGKPFPRRPSFKGKGREYSGDKYDKYIDGLSSSSKKSNWFKERIIDDWKKTLKAEIKAPKATATTTDDYDTDALPGAFGISVNLNPVEWIKGPKKQATETIQDWVKKGLGVDLESLVSSDFTDYKNNIESDLWAQALGVREGAEKGFIEKATTKSLSEMLFKGGFEKTDASADNSLKLKDEVTRYKDAAGRTWEKRKVYDSVADSVLKFERGKRGMPSRRTSHDIFLGNSLQSINEEIQLRKNEILSTPSGSNFKGAIKKLEVQAGLGANMTAVNKAVADYKTALEKVKLVGSLKNIAEVREKLIEYKISVKDAVKNFNPDSSDTTSLMTQAREAFSRGEITRESYENLQQQTSGFKSYVNQLEKTALKRIDKVLEKPVVAKILSRDDPENIGNSLSRKFHREIIERQIHETGTSGKLKDSLGNLIRSDDLEAEGIQLHARKVRALSNKLQAERTYEATEDMLKMLDKGNFFEKNVWNRAKDKFKKLTPAYWTEKALKKINYFGLVIDDDKPPRLFKKLKTYKFVIDMRDGAGNLIGGFRKLKLQGGDHFKAVNKISGIVGLGSSTFDEDSLRAMLMGRMNPMDPKASTELLAYREWLAVNEDLFGKENLENEDFQLNLFLKLHGYNKEQKFGGFEITKKYIGGLQKLYKRLNNWKKEIIKRLSFIKNIKNFRDLIRYKVKAFIDDKIMKIFSEKVAAFLISKAFPVIGAFLKFAVKKAVDTLMKFTENLMKGDFDKAISEVEEELVKVLKWLAISMSIIIGVIASIIILIVAIFSSATSPVDPTVGTSELMLESVFPGKNLVVSITKDVEVKLSNGEVLQNPSYIENKEVVSGLEISYVVTVTPLVSLEGVTVTVSDTVTARNREESNEVESFPSFTVSNVAAGEEQKTSLGPFTLEGKQYQDSLINNYAIAHTPAIEGLTGIDSVGYSKSFAIGNALSVTRGCEHLDIGALPQKYPAGSIANEAYSIALSLERGFWCYFNRPNPKQLTKPGGVTIFDDHLYAMYGPDRPGVDQIVYTSGDPSRNLFWCTWLVIKGYQQKGEMLLLNPSEGGVGAAVSTMRTYFSSGGQGRLSYVTRDNITASKLRAGDAIFYETGGTVGSGEHVGIVYKVTGDYIVTLESNAEYLTTTISVDPDTGRVHSTSHYGFEIVGFGLYR